MRFNLLIHKNRINMWIIQICIQPAKKILKIKITYYMKKKRSNIFFLNLLQLIPYSLTDFCNYRSGKTLKIRTTN